MTAQNRDRALDVRLPVVGPPRQELGQQTRVLPADACDLPVVDMIEVSERTRSG